MKIRNIILLFILLLIGIIFYKIKEGLTFQEAESEVNDLTLELNNAIKEKRYNDVSLLQERLLLAKKTYVSTIQSLTEERNKVNPTTIKIDLGKQLELEKIQNAKNIELIKKNQFNEDKQNYDNYIEQNQGYFESLTNKAKKIISDQINAITQLKQQAIDNNFIINDVPKKPVFNKTRDRYLDPECNEDEYVYCSGDKITCEDIFGNPLKDMVETKNGNSKTYSGCGSALNSKSYSQFLDDMTTGLTVEGTQSVFYDIASCPLDTPWRVDISAGDLSFNVGYNTPGEGTLINSLVYKQNEVVYVDGEYLYNTYSTDPSFKKIEKKHKSIINKKVYYRGLVKEARDNMYDVYIPDYKKEAFLNIDLKYLYKLVEENTLSGVYVTDNYQCYTNPTVASGISKFNNKSSKNLYINSVVYVDGDYLYDKYKDDRLFKLIRAQTKIWVNNKVCYKGVIKNIRTNNNFDVAIPDYNGEIFYDISNKYLYTINLEYTNDLNSTLTDLKIGSLPRPVCKNGNFTKKCSNKIPNDIEFVQTPNNTGYSADAYPLLMSEGNEETCTSKLNFSPY